MKNRGDSISFNLDGKWFGTGKVLAVREAKAQYVVALDDPCKEFDAGDQIEVDHAELVV
jgi:hypothetical protein